MSIGMLRVLQQHHIIDRSQAEYYSRLQEGGNPVLPQLFADRIITPGALAELMAKVFAYPQIDLQHHSKTDIPTGIIDEETMRQHRCIPISQRGNIVQLAVSDPTRLQTYQKILFAQGLAVDLLIAEDDKLEALIESLVQRSTAILQEIHAEAEEGATASYTGDEAEDGPIARFIHKTLSDALDAGASDIHFEFYEQSARVRFRIDGQLREVVQPPLAVRSRLASRIKVMAKLDISEKRIPQDGKVRLYFDRQRQHTDFRVSTLPTLFGEKVVMRVLNADTAAFDIDRLGLEPFQQTRLLEAIRRPYGMILVTGPTGSGKTVTLYACLNRLNTETANIATVEDPAEINLPGINQVNVNEKQGLTFAAALRAFLRQDPDILMVGEIRDLETADIAIKAAQTGHMVFSTLHTNRAPATLTRLLNMGVAPFNIAGSISLIVAQRLLRKLCTHCRQAAPMPSENILKQAGFTEQDLKEDWTLYRAAGCTHCRNKGYKGRIGIYELMPLNEEIQRIIVQGGTEADISRAAYRAGMTDLRRAGIHKVKQGITSLEEVLINTND